MGFGKWMRFLRVYLTTYIGIVCFFTPTGGRGADVRARHLHREVIPDQYIVVFESSVQEADKAALGLSKKYGLELLYHYRFALKGFSAKIPPGLLKKLSAEPGVAVIEPDLKVTAFAQSLPTGVSRINAHLSAVANIDGVDERVDADIAILDSGIDLDHPDLNVVGGVSFIQSRGKKSANDGNGHGSHVAGTAAALDNTMGVVGVAPGARLWAVKVLDDFGNGTISSVIKGIDWVTGNAAVIDVANLSLGGIGKSDSFRTAIQNSVSAGVFYAVAAGNESRDVYGLDGIFDTSDDIIPAAYPEVASISALADSDGIEGGVGPTLSSGELDDTFGSSFSNFSQSAVPSNPVLSPGGAIDVAAPGVSILSTYKNGGYAIGTGTSMSSPHVAGLAALYIAAFGKPTDAFGVYAIRQVLIDSAEPQSLWGINIPNDPDVNPEGLADAQEATQNFVPPPDPTPTPTPPPDAESVLLVDGGSNSMSCKVDVKGKNSVLRITLTLVEEALGGSPVADVLINFQLLDPSGSPLSGSGYTDSQGKITFKLNRAPSGIYAASVLDATKTGYIYDTSFVDVDPNTGSIDATHETQCIVP